MKLWIGIAAAVVLAGAGLLIASLSFGQVNQGQVIEYDRAKGVLTLIEDTNFRDTANPKFDRLPPVTVRIPADPHEMGPQPEAGRLLDVNLEQRVLVIFDPAAAALRAIPFTLVESLESVFRDDPRVRGVRFPIIDRTRRTVQFYVARRRLLVTASLADEYLSMADDAFRIGDEVRYYYKNPMQALRLMNVSKTDIGKGS